MSPRFNRSNVLRNPLLSLFLVIATKPEASGDSEVGSGVLRESGSGWTGLDGKLSFRGYEAAGEILRTAKVFRVEEIPQSITNPMKVTFEKAGKRKKQHNSQLGTY